MTTTTHFPLITHSSLDAAVAYRNGSVITARQFLHDTDKVASTLPEKRHILNTCQDRYHFALGFAATLIADCISLMPSSLTAETLRSLQSLAPNYITLDDDEINKHLQADTPLHQHEITKIPQVKASQLAAWVFTSGSTGSPVPHAKRWGSLVKNVRIEGERLGLLDGANHTIIGTVPPQHMYGFESTVLVALQSGNAFDAGRPFYPADIHNAITATPQPRLLVTTPYHLHSLLASEIEVAAVNLIVSATAPLPKELAVEAESRLQSHLLEIYGCTETGQLATRRPAESAEWQLFDGIQLTMEGEKVTASGGHIERPITISDRLEITRHNHFLLHGRSEDMINIAGKRSSLSYLNHQAIAVEGVEDAVFFMPNSKTENPISRLTLFVVAPTLDRRSLMQALRDRIDPVFLPRPIIFVDALPRSKTGKLPQAALMALVEANAGKS